MKLSSQNKPKRLTISERRGLTYSCGRLLELPRLIIKSTPWVRVTFTKRTEWKPINGDQRGRCHKLVGKSLSSAKVKHKTCSIIDTGCFALKRVPDGHMVDYAHDVCSEVAREQLVRGSWMDKGQSLACT